MGICPKVLSIEEDEKIETARRSVAAHAERMKLRDQFAAAALTGMMEPEDDAATDYYRRLIANAAYLWADAMLEARDGALSTR